MHTGTQLASSMFGVSVTGRAAETRDVFPGWGRGDRFGMVIDTPLGAAGGNLLIQAAIAEFYDFQRANGGLAQIYPEIYFFHLHRWHGDLANYDAWPPHKEILVEDLGDLGRLIAERSITWLAVPDGLSA